MEFQTRASRNRNRSPLTTHHTNLKTIVPQTDTQLKLYYVVSMMKSYENTNYRLRAAPRERDRDVPNPEGANPSDGSDCISSHEILSGGVAFVLRNFLSAEECQNYIHQAEEFGLTDCGYSKRIRRTDRVAVDASEEVAKLLFDRIQPYLNSNHMYDLSRKISTDRYPEGISKSVRPYNWQPIGLNPTFRICRYERKGFFLPHHDGGCIQDECN